MSMHDALFDDYPIPDDTYRLAHAVFPNGNLYLQLRDRYGMLFDNQRFLHLFSAEGHPALAPARLALVTLFQFMERLTDRQAADHVRDRISWKYALGLPLDDPGFDSADPRTFSVSTLAKNPPKSREGPSTPNSAKLSCKASVTRCVQS